MVPESLHSEIEAAWSDVLRSGRYVLGEQLEAFESELAAYLGVKHVVGVGSGTDALTLALRASGIGPGDEVIVPALTFIATAEAVCHVGATPVFCDVDIDTWTLTLDTVEPELTAKTKAIIPVDLFGNPAPYDELRQLDWLTIIEDACQAVGSTYQGHMCGSLGDAAAISFYPSKNLPGFGDGGAVATDDTEIAKQVALLRSHGSSDGRKHEITGFTSRLDELQAAALRVMLRNLPESIEDRKLWGRKFAYNFGSRAQRITEGGDSSWHQYGSKLTNRDAKLKPGGRSRVYYDPPLHQQRAMQEYYRGPLPTAEALSKLIVCTQLF